MVNTDHHLKQWDPPYPLLSTACHRVPFKVMIIIKLCKDLIPGVIETNFSLHCCSQFQGRNWYLPSFFFTIHSIHFPPLANSLAGLVFLSAEMTLLFIPGRSEPLAALCFGGNICFNFPSTLSFGIETQIFTPHECCGSTYTPLWSHYGTPIPAPLRN